MKFKNCFFIFGPPACGKDTQAKLLAKKFKIKKITTSDLLKKFFQKKKRYILIPDLAKGASTKKKIDLLEEKRKFIEGKLVDFHLVTYIIIETIKKEKSSLIFSGSPRSIVEAKGEYNFLKKENINSYFIFLDVPYKIALQRALGRKRKDLPLDAPEVFRRRWQEYEKHTLPAKNFLKKKGALIEIDGTKSVKEVYLDILKNLKENVV